MSDFSFGEHLFQSYHGKFFPDSQFSCIFIYYLIILAFQYNSRISSKGFFWFCVFSSWFFEKLHASMHETCVWVVAYVTVCVKIENYFLNKPQLAHMVPVSTTRLVSVIPHCVLIMSLYKQTHTTIASNDGHIHQSESLKQN